ncbi:MAG: helix-turn-helix domain-containing protein [Bacteroidia bacterium]|nr:helix-turn-helix domain-containing protein [Bacteroidia bacterium]
MALYELSPSPAWQAYVRTYRVVHFVFGPGVVPPVKPYPPRPEHCLSFYPRDTERITYAASGQQASHLRAAVIGQPSEVTNRYVGRDFLVFQVVFRPGALYRITGIPSTELTNAYIDAEAIFSGGIREVNEQLDAAADYAAMAAVVETFLSRQIRLINKDIHPLDRVMNTLLQSPAPPPIDVLADAACLSLRQFERRCLERLGVTPKYFCKVMRFEQAYRMRNLHPDADWLTIALHCGYHDYQHLAKDYLSLTGKTPNGFHLDDMAAPERKFGVADTY